MVADESPTDGGGSEVLVRRHGLLLKLYLYAGAGVTVWLVATSLFEPWAQAWAKPMFVVLGLGGALIFVLIARREMVVRPHDVAIRNLRTIVIPWSSVVAVDPTRYGLSFDLADGRRVVAGVTAKSGLVFLPVRYDKELLAELRSRIGGRPGAT
jgi:hypothetical protein